MLKSFRESYYLIFILLFNLYPNFKNISNQLLFKMRGKPTTKPPAHKKISRPGLTEDEVEELR